MGVIQTERVSIVAIIIAAAVYCIITPSVVPVANAQVKKYLSLSSSQ
jgi:hypothetical protein